MGSTAITLTEAGSNMATGIWLFGNGRPVSGWYSCGHAGTHCEKSPLRWATVGTKALESDARLVMRVRCQPAKKNVLLRRIGPPAKPPYWLRLRASFVG